MIQDEYLEDDTFVDWVIDVQPGFNGLIDTEDIYAELDIDPSNFPPRHRATVPHIQYDERGLPCHVIRIEFRIGVNESGWKVKEDVSELEESSYFIERRHGADGTYVNFYFETPHSIEEAMNKYESEVLN